MSHITARVLAIAIASALTACVSALQEAQRPPAAWATISASRRCEALSGTYATDGTPAAENSRAEIRDSTWPIDSLDALVERGDNTRSVTRAAAVRIDVDSAGQATFSAQDGDGQSQPLQSSAWSCDGVSLVTRTTLDETGRPHSARHHEESYVRLWKNTDGALVAEETIESVEHHLRRSAPIHRPLARFYFRFTPALSEATPTRSADRT